MVTLNIIVLGGERELIERLFPLEGKEYYKKEK